MLDCELFGLKPWGHHLTSILFHAVNTTLLFFVLRRMTGATWRSAIVAKTPFFVAALVVSGVTYAVQKQGGAVTVGLPWSGRIENAIISYCRYLGKLFWPADLAVFYPTVPQWPLVTVAGASALLIA